MPIPSAAPTVEAFLAAARHAVAVTAVRWCAARGTIAESPTR
jgi:hypothetical protein